MILLIRLLLVLRLIRIGWRGTRKLYGLRANDRYVLNLRVTFEQSTDYPCITEEDEK